MSRIRTAALVATLAALATTPAFAGETAAAPGKKAAAPAKKAAVEKTAAAPAAELPAAPAVIGSVLTEKKVNPLAAALARAAAAPTVKPDTKMPAAARAGGLSDLHDTCRRNAGKKLLGRHAEKVPSGEVVVHMKAATLGQTDISTVINRQLSQLQFCYESLVARGKRIDHHSGLHFVVEPKGYVSSARVSAAGTDARLLERCISSRVKSWRFPAADAPTIVDYPLVFESNTDPN